VFALLVSHQNLEEEQIFDHPGFGKTLAGMCVALVWISPRADPDFSHT
jgi:hypothetical protein